jgi:hypothetical protein
MKKTLAIVGLGVATAVASARTPYVGASVGYLLDSKEEYLSARVGFDIAETAKLRHSLEAEVGNTTDRDGQSSRGSITPITLNYRATAPLGEKWTLSSGFGVGASVVDVRIRGWYGMVVGSFTSTDDYTGFYTNSYGYYDKSDRAMAFTWQAFVGGEFQIAHSLSITASARYLWIGDATLWGDSFRVGDDVSLELGVSWKF